ncbi:MAG: SMP-30/gluconolactonase/LRE family protein [Akkermansiaceae bacterium]|nr:SMP-30/gluconolactonase/LRE family protein [Akkermansiaceae bacterium]
MENIELTGSHRAQWGEGPIWWQNRLIYVDIEAGQLLEYDPVSGRESNWDVSAHIGRIGTVVPRAFNGPEGNLIIAGDKGIHFFDQQTNKSVPICDPEADISENRFNDGKCSPDGRFFAGTISTIKKTGSATLYRLDTDLSLHPAYKGVTNSNGIVWSQDQSICYYIDTPRREILAFDYDPETGELSGQRSAVSTSNISASPDGMTIDSGDNLWVAFCHGSCVICYDPNTGKQLHRIDFPCMETTACAFGGENLDELFVTTGIHNSVKEADAGRLFRVTGLGVSGVPSHSFHG